MLTTTRPLLRSAAVLAGLGLIAACQSGPAIAPPFETFTPGQSGSPTPDETTSAGATPPPATSTAVTTGTPSDKAAQACATTVFKRMTPDQRAGQLLIVGLDSNADPITLRGVIRDNHVGNVIYLGGWRGQEGVQQTSQTLQSYVTTDSTSDIQLFIAADQEGGQVQQLKGDGFTRMPSALEQSTSSPAALTKSATTWSGELKVAGINVNLAPVADTVPTSVGVDNDPIGRWGRQYGSTPGAVSPYVTAFTAGMRANGIIATVKHFPGIGRIRANTDLSATGITDNVMTPDDPYLEPFKAGIKAGADFVMVSSARYPKIDPDNQAAFSSPIITGLLRKKLGFTGVVVTDDLNAAAVAGVPVGERATRFIAAGGDLVLTGDPRQAQPMLAALLAKAASDPTFQAQLDASTKRVLTVKAKNGLVPGCSLSSGGS